jgi:hypothetical protein
MAADIRSAPLQLDIERHLHSNPLGGRSHACSASRVAGRDVHGVLTLGLVPVAFVFEMLLPHHGLATLLERYLIGVRGPFEDKVGILVRPASAL